MCSLFLNGVLGLHIQLTGHLVTVVALKESVQCLAVTANGTADRRGVSGEYSRYLRNIVFKEQRTQSAHPLMSVVNNGIIGADVKVVEALYSHSSGI